MESISLSTLYILLLLLPGFTSWMVDRSLVFRPEESNLDKSIRALFYTFVSHATYAIVVGEFSPWDISFNGPKLLVEISSVPKLILLFLIAVILGCISGLFKSHDWHMKLARRMGLTNRTSRSSIWIDVFTDKRGSDIIVHLNDSRRIYGWPEYFSDQYRDGPMVFLSNAKWLEEDNTTVDIPKPGILVNSKEIKFIQFISEG